MTVSKPKRKLFHDRYEIQTIIGRGSKSVVYRAKVAENTEQIVTRLQDVECTPSTNKLVNKPLLTEGMTVALKVILPPSSEESHTQDRLKAEALALSTCQHPSIIRLYDVQVHDIVCYLALQYAPFGDLRKYALQTTEGFISPLEGQTLFRQALEALAFIHSAGIIHRDIKPDNLLIVASGNLCLGDFGVASFSGDISKTTSELTKAVGTLDYLAPEVLSGIRCDEKSDLYSLALSFYEMLSGKHPFSHRSLISQIEARGNVPLSIEKVLNAPRFSPISSEFARVMMNCLEPDASLRPSSAKEALLQLDKIPLKTVLQGMLPKFGASKPIVDKATIEQISRHDDTECEEEKILLNDNSARAVANESPRKKGMSDDRDNSDHDNGKANPKERLQASRARTELLTAEQLREVRKKFGAKVENEFTEKANTKKSTKDNESTRAKARKTQNSKSSKIFKLLILFFICLVIGGLIILYKWRVKSQLQAPSDTTTNTLGEGTAEESKLKLTLPQYTGAPLSFPALPEGVFHGLIEGLISGRPIPLAFISFGNSTPVLVLIGLEGFQTTSINVDPNEDSLKIPANGYILEFTSIKTGQQTALGGNVANLTTGEVGTWKVLPQAQSVKP